MSKGIDIRGMVEQARERSEDGRLDFYTLMTAMEYVRATGREAGPIDGKCEVCHKPWDGSWTLHNYLDWHCGDCTKAAFLSEHRAYLDWMAAGGHPAGYPA